MHQGRAEGVLLPKGPGTAIDAPAHFTFPPSASVLSRPQRLGAYHGRGLQLLLRRTPNAEGLGWVCFDDGAEAELPMAELSLTVLRQHSANRR